MCGISGFVDFNNRSSKDILDKMISTLKHRGPDDLGTAFYGIDNIKVGLAQSRLSVIDLSIDGHQPMHYKHYSVVFNGEIYNYKELREVLTGLGHDFKTQSDTEVILHAYEEWGNEAVQQFIGMFAIVIYNHEKQELLIFRDRAGVKPLFYYFNKGVFLFSSELKAFHQHPQFEKNIDKKALANYFDFGYIPAPHSIFLNTYKLNPGCHLSLDLSNAKIEIETYWGVENFYRNPKRDIKYEEAKEQLNSLLKSACNYRMVADVPVGVFLSGGYDSTAVTALLQCNRTEKLKTFTIGFEEGNNEAPFAQQTADYLGTDHHEYICTTKDAQKIIPELPYFYDEPFADSSSIPTILVSKFARKEVTVALSADAGDEVFAGYNSYVSLKKNLEQLNQIPDFLKPAIGKMTGIAANFIPLSKSSLKHKLQGVATSIQSNQFQQAADLFRQMNSLPNDYRRMLFNDSQQGYNTPYHINPKGFSEVLELSLAVDYQMYLQNDILTKVDRATMSVSLEGREPLLDHRLIEFAATLPLNFKYDGVTTKKILKDIVHQYIPENLMDRPKSGFSLPIYKWLNGELSYLIDEYLNEVSLAKSGLFNVNFVKNQVQQYKEDKLHYLPFIWKLLMFQMWYAKWM